MTILAWTWTTLRTYSATVPGPNDKMNLDDKNDRPVDRKNNKKETHTDRNTIQMFYDQTDEKQTVNGPMTLFYK